MKELLEDYYGRGDEAFFRFVDTYAQGRTDAGLEEYILKVWQFAQSSPWPEEWFLKCRNELSMEADGDFKETEWMKFLIADVKKQAGEYLELLSRAVEAAEEDDGPQAYLPMLSEDVMGHGGAFHGRDLRGNLRGSGKAHVRPPGSRPRKKRGSGKERICSRAPKPGKGRHRKLKALYLPGPVLEVAADMAACLGPVSMLLELSEEFDAPLPGGQKGKGSGGF